MNSRDFTISIPWFNRHAPYLCLHFCRWGDQCFKGKCRPIYHIGIIAGKYFQQGSQFVKWFDVHGLWRQMP